VAYPILKFLHILGVILLVGNVTVTAVWKVFADRTHNPVVIAFGQRLVTITDWFLTGVGIAFVVIGGYGMVYVADLDPFGAFWLVWGQVLFVLSGLIWALLLIPAQIRQAREARGFAEGGEIPPSYRRDAVRWIFWGVVATVPLVAAVWLMVVKPV
jgi:uncharacterized membrane protein